MVDFVSYCIVMWFALIHIIRTKQQEWGSVETTGTEPLKAQPDKLVSLNVHRLIRKFREDFFRRKGGVLWDTS